jgi:hypothetical protein
MHRVSQSGACWRHSARGIRVGAVELPGCARLELAQEVVPLNPQEACSKGCWRAGPRSGTDLLMQKRHPMSRYMTFMYGLCDASGHR